MKSFTTAARVFAASVLMALAGAAAGQPAYPSKPIRFIVPYPPGGSTDSMARLVGQKLAESWGQQVIMDNRPGGNTIIGTEALLKSPPDGYTILLVTAAHVTTPQLFPTSYDAIKDFAPVATIAGAEYVLVVHPSLPSGNLREFIAFAKARPGQLNYATAGSGGVQHLSSELFNLMAGLTIQQISYKGAAQALTDLIGGQVQLHFAPPINVISYIKSGRLKGLAIAGEARSPTLPQVPTFIEAGLPGFDAKNWFGVLARAGTPKDVVNKLSTEIARVLATPDSKEKLVGQGMDPFASSPDQFAELLKGDMAKYSKVIKSANIRIQQ